MSSEQSASVLGALEHREVKAISDAVKQSFETQAETKARVDLDTGPAHWNEPSAARLKKAKKHPELPFPV